MRFTEIFVRRPVMACAINLILLIVGLVAYYQLELRHMPKVANNEVMVSVIFPGANSLAVEHQVTKPLEDAIAGIDGIRKLNSESQDGACHIHVKFKSSIDTDKAISQVRDRVLATMSSLPEAVKRPDFQEQSEGDSPIMYLRFEDKTRSIAELTDYIRRMIEDRLRLVEGVARVGHFGNKLYLIAIKPDPALLTEHNVTVREIVEALRKEKTFASGGEIEGVTNKQSVVLKAMVEKPEDFRNVNVKITSKGRITIGDVATVSVAEKSTFLKIRSDGQEVVGLDIKAKPQANPLEVAKRIYQFMDDIKESLPPTMKAVVSFDMTREFAASFAEIRHTLWEAIVLVGLIVTLSLASFRAALLPIITVPLCLVGSFAIMSFLHFSINPVTLLALVLAVGLVVDDAIVVVENIYRHMELGNSALQAALKSMKEISFAVVVMTVTLAAVYMPLLFQMDDTAVLFREFAWTLAGSVIISGFVALTLTPALSAKFLKGSHRVQFWENLSFNYRRILQQALFYPKSMTTFLVIIGLLGLWGFERLPSELTPVEDEGYFQGSIISENSVPEAVKNDWFHQIESILKTIPEQERIMTGVWQDQWMWWSVLLKPLNERKRNSMEIMKTLRPQLMKVVGPMVFINENSNFGEDESLKIVIQDANDQSRLIETVNNIINDARTIPGISGLDSEQTWQKPRLQVLVDRALASELGVSIDAIEDTLYTLLSGRKAADFNFQGFDYDVEVRAPSKHRTELTHLNAFFVSGGEGQKVPLGSLVTLKEVLEPTQIKHYDRMRGAAINVSLTADISLDKAMSVLDPIIKKHLPHDAQYKFGGKAEKYKESKQSMLLTFGLALGFIYLVLAALFESFIYPFIVLLTVPLSMAGAVWAINAIGGTNNAYMSIGLVTLIGLITKHGILIVDFANRLRAEGVELKEAVLNAAESRLRPVLMTTLAMICGAIPLLFSRGAGAIAREHIGWVIIGGMISGTLFSLFVIPSVYSIIGKKYKPLIQDI